VDPVSQETYTKKSGQHTLTQGPYFLLERRESGKNHCQRAAASETKLIHALI